MLATRGHFINMLIFLLSCCQGDLRIFITKSTASIFDLSFRFLFSFCLYCSCVARKDVQHNVKPCTTGKGKCPVTFVGSLGSEVLGTLLYWVMVYLRAVPISLPYLSQPQSGTHTRLLGPLGEVSCAARISN